MRYAFFGFTPVCRSRCGTRGWSAAPAPGGLTGVWGRPLYVRLCVCRPIETTLSLGVWGRRRRARSECECECELCECECECGCACYCECACECECECVSGLFQMRWVARRFTPVCRSRCGARGADRGPGAGRFVRALGPLLLCVILLVQANRNDTCLLYTSPSPRDATLSRMPSSA